MVDFQEDFLEKIVSVHWPAGRYMALYAETDFIAPSPFQVPIVGLPFAVADATIKTTVVNRAPAPPIKLNPITSAMLSGYKMFPVFGETHATFRQAIHIIPFSPLGKKKAYHFSLTWPGFGSQFITTHTQDLWVPWDLNTAGPAYPGNDFDEFGFVFPFWYAANANATLIIGGSPPAGDAELFGDPGHGAWPTLAESNQQCAALNSFFGASVNFVSQPFTFHFNQFCGVGGQVIAQIWDFKTYKKWDVTSMPSDPNMIQQVGGSRVTGHGPRTTNFVDHPSKNFTNTGTARNGVGFTANLTLNTSTSTLVLSFT